MSVFLFFTGVALMAFVVQLFFYIGCAKGDLVR